MSFLNLPWPEYSLYAVVYLFIAFSLIVVGKEQGGSKELDTDRA